VLAADPAPGGVAEPVLQRYVNDDNDLTDITVRTATGVSTITPRPTTRSTTTRPVLDRCGCTGPGAPPAHHHRPSRVRRRRHPQGSGAFLDRPI